MMVLAMLLAGWHSDSMQINLKMTLANPGVTLDTRVLVPGITTVALDDGLWYVDGKSLARLDKRLMITRSGQ